MKSGKMIEIFKSGNFVVPLYLFKLREKFGVAFEEFIFLMYLSSLGERSIFDPSKISSDLNISLENVMIFVDHLTDRGLIEVVVLKNDKGMMEEYILLKLYYEKISQLLVNEIESDEKVTIEKKKTIYDLVADGFARPISSIEREIIGSWVENGFSEDLIMAALKEAVFNGVSNLRYMDKILYEWNKKGYKNPMDVEISKQKYQEEQRKKEKLDLFDYDWFDDDE